MGIMKLELMTNQQQASTFLKATGKLKYTVQIFSQNLWLEIHTYKLWLKTKLSMIDALHKDKENDIKK